MWLVAALWACAAAATPTVPDMGQDGVFVAGMASLFCHRPSDIACLNFGIYNRLKRDHPGKFFSIQALATVAEGPCINIWQEEKCPANKVAFGTVEDCAACVQRGYGWCDKAYFDDDDTKPALAPTCMDRAFKKCPFFDEAPLTEEQHCEGMYFGKPVY